MGRVAGLQLSGPGLMADICSAGLLQTPQPPESILQVLWQGLPSAVLGRINDNLFLC